MAHQEAWYTESSNPFRRTREWVDGGPNASHDMENGPGSPEIGRVFSAPVPGTRQSVNIGQHLDEDAISPSTLEPGIIYHGEKKIEMAGAAAGDRPNEHTSEETVVASQSSSQTPSEEQSMRQRLIAKLRGHRTEKSENSKSTTGISLKSSKTKKSLKHKPFTVGSQLRATIFNSWINILLIAAPIGIAIHFTKAPPVAVFVINFIAIIPLAALLSFATEEIALRVGETLGGLLNATFGFVHLSHAPLP
jgi:Ca2+:H+ antiporter